MNLTKAHDAGIFQLIIVIVDPFYELWFLKTRKRIHLKNCLQGWESLTMVITVYLKMRLTKPNDHRESPGKFPSICTNFEPLPIMVLSR